MSRVSLKPLARADLLAIWAYISQDSEKAADEVIDSIDASVQLLANQPKIGRAREELLPGLLSFPVGHYVVYYRQISGGILILRVLHEAQAVERKFPKLGN